MKDKNLSNSKSFLKTFTFKRKTKEYNHITEEKLKPYENSDIEKTRCFIPEKRKKTYHKIYFLSFLIGVFSITLAMLIFAAVMWIFQMPTESADMFMLLAIGIGGVFSGAFTGNVNGQKGLKSGFTSALSLASLILIIGIIGSVPGGIIFERIFSLFFCSLCGGVIGVNNVS